MSAGWAASRVLVCLLVWSMTMPAALAQEVPRRPVAVVNLDLSGDPEAIELAMAVVRALDTHPRLRGAPDPGAVAALYEPIDDRDPSLIARAVVDRDKALDAINNFDYPGAIQHAEEGARELLAVTPTLAAKPYAELAFVRGKALVEARNLAAARLAFAHAQRLDPTRTLDVTREKPDVVTAYNAAMAAGAPTGTLEVKGDGHVWIDGTEMGIAPVTFTVTAGLHAVWLTGVDRETRGAEVEVVAGTPTVVEIPIAVASARTRVQRARQVLARSPDASARAAAMKRLAELVGVSDALLLSVNASGKQIAQSWRAGDVESPGFSTLSERGTRTPGELLDVLSPPPPKAEPPPVTFPVPYERQSWYQSTGAKVALGFGSVVAVGVGIYILASVLRPESVQGPVDIGWGMPDGAIAR